MNDKVFAKEREDNMVFHPGKIVQILQNGWINVGWEWREFSPESTSRVHEIWIRDSNEPQQRYDTDYYYDDNVCINCSSIGRDGLFVRVPFNDDPHP